MIRLWLEAPVAVIIASTALVYGGAAFGLHWLSFRGRFAPAAQSLRGVVAPFFSVTAVLFALFLGFLANEVWERNRQATRAVAAERDSLSAIRALAAASPDGARLIGAAEAYAAAAVEQDWPAMADGGQAPQARQALDDLLLLAATARQTRPGVVDHALLDAAQDLRKARDARLALAAQGPEELRWAIVHILALLTLASIALVHLERARPQAATLAIAATAITLSLSLTAVYEFPFQPPLSVSPAPLRQAISS